MIDKIALVNDIILWLPDDNIFTESQISKLVNPLISQIGDESENYAEILCKSLRLLAQLNLSKAQQNSSSLKRQRTDEVEFEYFEDSAINWKTYLDELKNICPLFGYSGLSLGSGMKINPSPVTVGVDCSCPDLYL